ncbi:MAG: GPR endopeptidase [Clostridia bacterium]|nr:GPR endopeptidase [Clostridia bacterium]
MDFRTDLALERSEIYGDNLPSGVVCSKEEASEVTITRIEITSEEGAEAIGKPCGKYITAEVPPFKRNGEASDESVQLLADEIAALLPKEGTVLVAGLGNRDITPDALGPVFCDKIFATRHIEKELAQNLGLGDLRPVVSLIPGVLGKTGMETSETLEGAVKKISPVAVITVDALAARRLSRLGSTVQISNVGVVPGSGVGNARMEISEKSLGVPVIAIGVPTVVDAATLVTDLGGGDEADEKLIREGADMMITPREIDLVIERAARLVSLSVNKALQPHLSTDEITILVS